MRPLIVELVDEVIEPLLLLEEVKTRRLGRLFLEGQVHAFVPAVLLRMAWLDALKVDTQAQPPDRQLAETEESGGRRKGDAIVGPHGGWQTETP